MSIRSTILYFYKCGIYFHLYNDVIEDRICLEIFNSKIEFESKVFFKIYKYFEKRKLKKLVKKTN